MKTRILSLLLVLVMAVGMLASCGGGPATCTNHTDADGNLKCDTCGADVACTNHVDKNHDQKCDACKTAVPCEHEIDEDGFCAWCDYIKCMKHIDRDHNLVCDNDGCDKPTSNRPCVHIDANDDGKCDKCEEDK